MVTVETSTGIDLFAMPPLELIGTGEKLARDEEISLEKVETEFAIVDESHADDLKQSMAQERGQISPIVVRAKKVEGEIFYDIIDGFHRTEGMRQLGEATISARVLYGCDDEELFDQRILAASSVKSVQFPRVAAWINNSFSETAWAKKGLTATLALGLTVADSESSRQNLSNEEVSELKEWVRKKCRQWGRTPGDTYRILRIVSKSNPELVKEVRSSGGGKDRRARITPERLAAVALALPGEENFAAQIAIMDYVLEERLFAEETKQLVSKIAPAIEPGMDKETVSRIIEQAVLSSDSPQLDQIPATREAETHDNVRSPSEEELLEIEAERLEQLDIQISPEGLEDDQASESLESTMEEIPLIDPQPSEIESEYQDGSDSITPRRKPRYPAGKQRKANFMGPTLNNVEAMRERIEELEKIAKEARNGHSNNDGRFWRTAEYLTTTERKAMKLVFENFKDIKVTAKTLGIPSRIVYQLIVSSFAKHTIIGRPEN